MKKRGFRSFISIFICMIMLVCVPTEVIRASSPLKLVYGGKKVTYKKSTVGYELNGSSIELNGIPGIIINNTAMGYYVDVVKKGLNASCKYDKEKKKLTITKFDKEIKLTLGSKTAYVNGKKKKMDVAMTKVKFVDAGVSKIMVPIRFVTENLGYKYKWNESKVTGEITREWLELYKDKTWIKYTGTKVQTSYNGKLVTNVTMPGIIVNNTTLLDGEGIFGETLGIECKYDSKNKTITLTKDDNELIFRLNKATALWNGEEVSVSVNACRVKNRADKKYYLMVPARFTANTFGYDYNWNSRTNRSEISDPKPELPQESVFSGSAIYFKLPENVSQGAIKHADRYWENEFNITIPGDYVSEIEDTIVLLEKEKVSNYKVSLASAGKTKITVQTKQLQGYKVEVKDEFVCVKIGNPKDIYKNIVVLDCGHGGTDPGARADGYNEKDITYDILYSYAKNHFDSKDSNVKAYWTRTDDTYVGLSDRAAFASKVGADLFVSLHMNSATNQSAKGTEVYYSKDNNKTLSNGLNSSIVAQKFQSKLLEVLGSKDRKVKTANYVVIYKNTVPAVLIELGFLSNAEERENLIDEEYQKKSAKAIYQVVEDVFENYPTGR